MICCTAARNFHNYRKCVKLFHIGGSIEFLGVGWPAGGGVRPLLAVGIRPYHQGRNFWNNNILIKLYMVSLY